MDTIEKKRAIWNEIYKEYGNYAYLPMREARNIAIPISIGCSYNKCLFCDLNGKLQFKVFTDREITDKISLLKEYYKGRKIMPDRAVLMGGNPFAIPTEKLIKISDYIKEAFPHIKYIASFARADDILKKSESELKSLKNSGYDNLTIGIESGSDICLKFHKKGVGKRENLTSMKKLESLNIAYSAYVILGFGGAEYQKYHIKETISLFNGRTPTELIFLSLVLFKGAGLVKKVREKKFQRLSPKELMKEELYFIKNLETETIFNGTHKNNAIPIKGILPKQREIMAKKLSLEIEKMTEKSERIYEAKRWQSWTNE